MCSACGTILDAFGALVAQISGEFECALEHKKVRPAFCQCRRMGSWSWLTFWVRGNNDSLGAQMAPGDARRGRRSSKHPCPDRQGPTEQQPDMDSVKVYV